MWIKGAEGQYVVAAVAGGTASQLAGGRFANGALTAAFGYLFNQLAHGDFSGDMGSPESNPARGESDTAADRVLGSGLKLAVYSIPGVECAVEGCGAGGWGLAVASTLPVGNAARLGHIFRDAIGHVNPSTLASQARYWRIFESVASDPANARLVVNPQKLNAGVKAFTKDFRAGQVWVEARGGGIIDAGVNRPGAFR